MDLDNFFKATKNVSEAFPKLYNDTFQPSAQNLGKAFGTVTELVNTVLTPIELLNKTTSAKKQKFLEEYEKNLHSIPPEKICSPNFAIAGPIIDHVKFKLDETELRKKYAKLLSEASNCDNLSKPLLAFDNVLNQLSPYEIELLSQIFSLDPSQNHAIASIKIINNPGWSYTHRDIADINFKGLTFDIISTMLSNYERLGLIYIDRIQYLNNDEHYDYLKKSLLFQKIEDECNSMRTQTGASHPTCAIEKGYFYLTHFGLSFVQTIIL